MLSASSESLWLDDSDKHSSADLLRDTISVISRWACRSTISPKPILRTPRSLDLSICSTFFCVLATLPQVSLARTRTYVIPLYTVCHDVDPLLTAPSRLTFFHNQIPSSTRIIDTYFFLHSGQFRGQTCPYYYCDRLQPCCVCYLL